jgi:prophage tail gpP-like protein
VANGIIELPPVDVTSDQPSTTTSGLPPTNGGVGIQTTPAVAGEGAGTAYPFSLPTSRYFDSFDLPEFSDRVVVIVNGEIYAEWESVTVTVKFNDPPNIFELRTSEQEPWPEDWAFLRIKPHDQCAVYLDGQLVISGMVITRQVYYDANQHTIQIQGADYTIRLGHSAADTKTGEFKQKNAEAIISALAGAAGVGTEKGGAMFDQKFPRFSIHPGETAKEAIERVARAANLMLGANKHGQLMIIGPNAVAAGYDAVIEGVNILIGQEFIHANISPGEAMTSGQNPVNDDNNNPAEAAQMSNQQGGQAGDGTASGGFGMGAPQRTLSELPAFSIAQLIKRAKLGGQIDSADEITAWITVLGWQRHGSSGLWWPGDTVYIDAPMLILKQDLRIKSVVFTQDNQTGTRARLELVRPEFLGGEPQA